MLKSTQESFPHEGVALHITAQDALAYGIKPGQPAVVEATVRPYTVQEWIVEGAERTFATEDEEAKGVRLNDDYRRQRTHPPRERPEPAAPARSACLRRRCAGR